MAGPPRKHVPKPTHQNKYAEFSKADELARELARKRNCTGKKQFMTKLEAANSCGGDSYLCEFCHRYHGTAKAFKIAAGLNKMLKPHQQRVVNEKRELDEKIEKLNQFMIGEAFREVRKSLSNAELERMSRQLSIMQDYSGVLDERIEAFE